jgi:hypothetical protein
MVEISLWRWPFETFFEFFFYPNEEHVHNLGHKSERDNLIADYSSFTETMIPHQVWWLFDQPN